MASFTLTGSSSVARTLNNNEYGFIGTNGSLYVAGEAINGSGLNYLTVNGTLASISGNDEAYDFDGTTAYVNIGANGFVSAFGTAMDLFASSLVEVTNAGTIQSDDRAFYLRDSDPTATFEIMNSGDILSGDDAVEVLVDDSNFNFTNTGYVQSTNKAFDISTGNGADVEISNSGDILAGSEGIEASMASNSDFNLVNTGDILSDFIGLDLSGNAGTEFNIINSGNISGIIDGVQKSGLADLTLINTGTISGATQAIDFISGTNVYDGRLGQAIGLIEGGFGADTILGGDGEEEVNGDLGNDILYGFGGNDILDGDSGRDVIRGGAGADAMDGGSGNQDYLDYRGSTEAVIVNLGTGQAEGGDASGDQFQNFEYLIGSNLDDTLTGNTGDNFIRGDAGQDFIRSGSGDDLVAGGRGADNMLGSSGIDTLDYRTSMEGVFVNMVAGTGQGGDAQGDTFTGFENVIGSNFDDMFYGNNVANQMVGGTGADIFHFRSNPNAAQMDTIADFVSGVDTIELAQFVFSDIVQPTGTMLSGYFKANAAGVATDANDRIIYDTDDGFLYYDTNGDAAGGSTLFAQLSSAPALAFTDFEIV